MTKNGKANAAAAQQAPPQHEAKAQPVHEIRMGRIKAAVWANQTAEHGVRHNVTICRLYKDEVGWKRSESFGREDLPLVCKVADLAFSWIYEHGSAMRQDGDLPQ